MNINGTIYDVVPAPAGTTRLIPSRFPPIGLIDDATTEDDLRHALDLEGWTSDRLVKSRLERLGTSELVYGRPNATIVLAAFLHASAGGLRFSDSNLGAWYASTRLETAIVEIANGLRKEISLSALTRKMESYRQYKARLCGGFIDIISIHPEYHDPDDASYPASQTFGNFVRSKLNRAEAVGIRYESVRNPGNENWVCFHPPAIVDVVQADHFKIEVPQTGKVIVRKLS